MPEALDQLLALPGLVWIVLGTFVAGVVYGFAGFGAALIIMPVATAFVPVELAVAGFAVASLSSLFTVVPPAWPLVDRRGIAVLIGTAVLSSSAGIWVLRHADLTVLRWAVVGVTALTLAALLAGWRYRTAPTDGARAAVGLAAGFLGGSTGLLGPVMVLFQLAGRDSIATSRATATVFLTVTTALLLPLMALQGILTATALSLGALLFLPYGIGTRVGKRFFQPERERLYRNVAYLIIAVAIMVGLPIWNQEGG